MDKDDKFKAPAPVARDTAARPDAKFGLPAGYKHPSFHPPKKDPLVRKRSLGIAVGVLGVAAVGFAAFGGKDVQRNGYASREDCEHDYSTGQCAPDTSVSSSVAYGGGGYHYYGPWYRSDWRNGPVKGDPGPGRGFTSGSGFTGHGPTNMDFGHRGGFGSSGRVSARGG